METHCPAAASSRANYAATCSTSSKPTYQTTQLDVIGLYAILNHAITNKLKQKKFHEMNITF
jgi:hypothetical protein